MKYKYWNIMCVHNARAACTTYSARWRGIRLVWNYSKQYSSRVLDYIPLYAHPAGTVVRRTRCFHFVSAINNSKQNCSADAAERNNVWLGASARKSTAGSFSYLTVDECFWNFKRHAQCSAYMTTVIFLFANVARVDMLRARPRSDRSVQLQIN